MPEQPNSRIKVVNISKEMRTSFLDYSMSVIVSRALPDVRDGLKPVHRRILYAMNDLGINADKAYKKSARIVGEVIGKYHPHGDYAVYESMVRMAQDFNYRYMLVDGHGNFGSIDGDSAAAMRYTEARMSKISMELLKDINKNTVDFKNNYDESEQEPSVLPARFPNLLVNGGMGIAVGMATNIPPHNLTEVIDGILALRKNPEILSEELMTYIKGPDFPTGGIILGRSGIRKAYETGRGSIMIRGKADIETKSNGRETIIITELPYQVNKARLIEKIADLVREKRIEGITDLRDESDRKGMRIVIEVRKDANAGVIVNNLYKQTALQTSFGINMLALVDGRPMILTLKDVLQHYLNHQVEVTRRRTQYDLDRAKSRAHILEGLKKALDHIDAIINLIRSSETTEIAKEGLIQQFALTERQAQAILEMRLQRLTGLEREKIEDEYRSLLVFIGELSDILADPEKVLEIICNELIQIKEKYGDERRTELLLGGFDVLEDEDLIPVQNVAITLTNKGYIKRQLTSVYRTQKRGGRGVQGMGTHEDDFVEQMIATTTHHTLLFFTNLGKVYKIKGYEVPEFSRTAKGLPVVNLLEIDKEEKITAIIPIEKFEQENYLFFTTRQGIVKRVSLSYFRNIRTNGLIAVGLREQDELISVCLTNGKNEIIIGTSQGFLIHFDENDIRAMGRTAAGVRGIRLREGDHVVNAEIVKESSTLLTVTENGYGKRTPISEYRPQSRGGKGIINYKVTEKTGFVVGLQMVEEKDLMIVTDSGVIIRIPIEHISILSRNTQGVKLIRLDEHTKVSTIAIVETEETENEETKEPEM